MNSYALAAFLQLATPEVAGSVEGAFGLRMGTLTSQLQIKEKMPVEGGYSVIPPIPNEYFNSYTVVATPSEGVCSVMASGPVKQNRNDPSTARYLVSFMTRELSAIYGPATRSRNLEEAKSAGHEPFAFWDKPGRDYASISLSMITLDEYSFTSLTYTFTNHDKCVETIQKASARRARRGL